MRARVEKWTSWAGTSLWGHGDRSKIERNKISPRAVNIYSML